MKYQYIVLYKRNILRCIGNVSEVLGSEETPAQAQTGHKYMRIDKHNQHPPDNIVKPIYNQGQSKKLYICDQGGVDEAGQWTPLGQADEGRTSGVGQASDEEVPMNADTYESEWFQWFLDEGYGSEDDE